MQRKQRSRHKGHHTRLCSLSLLCSLTDPMLLVSPCMLFWVGSDENCVCLGQEVH